MFGKRADKNEMYTINSPYTIANIIFFSSFFFSWTKALLIHF